MVLKTAIFFFKLALAPLDGNAKGTSEADLSKVKFLIPFVAAECLQTDSYVVAPILRLLIEWLAVLHPAFSSCATPLLYYTQAYDAIEFVLPNM